MSQRRRARHAVRSRIPPGVPIGALAIALFAVVAWRLELWPFGGSEGAQATPSPAPTVASPLPSMPQTPSLPPSPTPEPSPEPANTGFDGITTFRGNESRSYYGEGPVPADPRILWRYPAEGSLCSNSSDEHGVRLWCGTGWTGQPNVLVGEDGEIEVRINAYDGAYHFLDGRTGEPVRPALQTGDLAKGSATSDPDGYPLYYAGSRDDFLRVIALDRAEPTVLWQLDANSSVPNPIWNNDWDGAPLIVGDYLLEGGENSWFYVIQPAPGIRRPRTGSSSTRRSSCTVPGFDERAARGPAELERVDRELRGVPRRRRVLRELRRARPGLGHLSRARRRPEGPSRIPVLDRRGHRRARS